MERTIKKTTGKLLAGFLAVIMVFSMFTTILTEADFGFLKAFAAGDDGDDTVHTNTAYSNTDYSVLTGEIALVGDGFGSKDLSEDIKELLGDGVTVKKYVMADSSTEGSVFAALDKISLVVFSCGTQKAINNDGTVAEFATSITGAVQNFKENGVDVLLVTPGPVTEYGANNYYATHADKWTPAGVAAGDNITNRLSDIVDAINAVAEEQNVGVLSLYGKSKLSGEAEYMAGSADGIFPGTYGYGLMARWIAEYISENYVISRGLVGSAQVASESDEIVINLDKSYNDIDAVFLTFASGTAVPKKISVQTTKSQADQWFEAVADVEITENTDGKTVASIVFESATAQYIRLSATEGTFPVGTKIEVHQTKLCNPVVTYPVAGNDVTTKHAFNIEWSGVAGADRFEVVIKDGDATVKSFITGEDVQAIPAGLFEDDTSYNITVKSLCSGYVESATHGGVGVSGTFTAHDDAVYNGNSETTEEAVSAGKLVSIGDQSVLTGSSEVTATVNGTETNLLVDGIIASYVGDTNTMSLLHTYTDHASTVEVVINLGEKYAAVTGVFFDASFFAVTSSANAKPESLTVSYSADGSSYGAERSMYVGTAIRTIAMSENSEINGDMTRYSETMGSNNVQYVKLVFTFADIDNSEFWLDEIHVVGSKKESGVVVRDGMTVFNQGLVGANRYDDNYTSGAWITDPRFVAVAAKGMVATPVELVISLNADMQNNAISYGNNVITGLEISYAADVNAIRPSSIVVSVRKEGESTWTEVGGKVYVDNGLVSEENAEFVTEYIPLTMADASDVEAAYVKITLYSKESNTEIPAAYDTSGTWGNWFALSHLEVKGGQYIGSIEADGATAAYHANYLQNTTLVGREGFGDVNNTDIWNSISWKTASYKTPDSGYLESNGNITVGKIYWASQTVVGSSSTNVIGGDTTSAVSPNVPTATTKAATNVAGSATYMYTGRYPNQGSGVAHADAPYYADNNFTSTGVYGTGKLNDGVSPAATYPSGGASTRNVNWAVYMGHTTNRTVTYKLNKNYNVTKLTVTYYVESGRYYVAPTVNDVKVGSSDTSLSSVGYSVSGLSTADGKHTMTITLNSAAVTQYVSVTFAGATTRLALGEIEVYGEEIATNVNIAEGKQYYYTVKPGIASVVRYEDTPNENANVWHTGELTDGHLATYTYNDSKENSWIGYIEAVGTVEFVVDLGAYYDVSKAEIELLWGGNIQNYCKQPDAVSVAFSTDGKTWRDSHSILSTYETRDVIWTTATTSSTYYSNGNFHYYSTTTPVSAVRYVKFTTTETKSNSRTIIDELRVYGTKMADNPPVISNVQITDLTSEGYTITATVTDDIYVSSVQFPTWTTANGQDDLIWYDGTISGNTVSYTVKTSDHNGEYGEYNTHIYADDGINDRVTYNLTVLVPSAGATEIKNWALESEGAIYKGSGNLYNNDGDRDTADWTTYHSGKLNDGDNIAEARDQAVALEGTGRTTAITFKLANSVSINNVKVYVWPRNGNYLADAKVYVSDSESYSEEDLFGSSNTDTVHSGTTHVYDIAGEASGRYVIIEVTNIEYLGHIVEIEIFGVAALDAPVVTSHREGSEIGKQTFLDWEDVVASDGSAVTYSVIITSSTGAVYTAATGLTSSEVTINVESNSALANLPEGNYQVSVIASAPGWVDGVSSLNVYYAPKYIISFTPGNEAVLKVLGQQLDYYQFGVYDNTTWDSAEVLGAVSSVTALPYTDANGNVFYFSHWVDSDGSVGIPSEDVITGNHSFTAVYTTSDTTGTLGSPYADNILNDGVEDNILTDGVIFDGRGNVSDYYFTFTNDGQADYVIIDLGEIYYALTEFDVSFYKMDGSELPAQISFEVSSKVYVPTIVQGAAFDDSDWQFVSVVNLSDTNNYVYDEATGRYSFSEHSKYAPIIDGAFGRYIKVTFYYDNTECDGVYVDEIMVSGSDDHDRTNIAEKKEATVGGAITALITDGKEDSTVNGSEFVVDLDEVKTGITSVALVGAGDTTASVYISAGGDDFVLVDTVVGDNGVYTLSDKVSARRVKVVLDASMDVSEFRVYGDPGLENYYFDTGLSASLELMTGTISLNNIVSVGATDAMLYGEDEDTEGTFTGGSGANGTGSGFAMTDGNDPGNANGVSFVTTSAGNLWYGLYTERKGLDSYIHASFTTDWIPTLDSTAVDFKIGNKTYKFEFNGDVNKGFVILNSGSATPFSYSAVRGDREWTVNFSVSYKDVGGVSEYGDLVDLTYNVTAYEGGASVGTSGDKIYTVDGQTEGWNYSDSDSTWSTLSSYEGNVIAWMELDHVYYGLNSFAISVLDAPTRGYVAPNSVKFQVSLDNQSWTDVGYTAKNAYGDYRYYSQYQPGTAYVRNYNVNFEGITAKYVRAVMDMTAKADSEEGVVRSVAVQEFWVNALPESLKIAGGDHATNSFDYKMLWDDEYLYVAIQYEEDEIPFYSASHDYFQTFATNYNTAQWHGSGNDGVKDTSNASVKSSLFYDASTGFFQMDNTVTRFNDDYSNAFLGEDFANFQLYKVSDLTFNNGTGHFGYGNATKATIIETSYTKYDRTDEKHPTLANDSTLNGYIIVSEGYALSQKIDGASLEAIPITINGDTIPAAQITNDLVWFFEDSDLVYEATEYSKSLGDYIIYGFRYESNNTKHIDRVFFDDASGMQYNKYYLTRAYQGLLWENVYTFPRAKDTHNTLFNYDINRTENTVTNDDGTTTTTYTYAPNNNGMLAVEPITGGEEFNLRNNNSASDVFWNVVNDGNGNWSFYTKAQGIESYSNYYDNVDGRSSFRLFMSVANLNDTARYDYGNYDFVLDTYILDDATITLNNGDVIPVSSDMDELYKGYVMAQDYQTSWDGYKSVEFKSTALGMTSETNEFKLDVSKLKGMAKMDQSINGQSLITVEIAIPFEQLGFKLNKTVNSEGTTTVTKWGNYYTKIGIEKPLGKRTLMQFDSKYSYTQDTNGYDDNVTSFEDVDEFYYYVDASEFGFVLQMAPEGKGYQDLSYTDGEGFSTVSSVRGEVLNTTNGKEIEYTPTTFDISKIHSTNKDPDYAEMVARIESTDAFKYVEENGIYYFTSQMEHGRVINQGGTISTELEIPSGGAYFSFDWKVQAETSDTLSVWVETTERWNQEYAEWIQGYNCGIPYKKYTNATTASQKSWLGVLDYADTGLYTLYSEIMSGAPIQNSNGATVTPDKTWKVNGVELKNDPCVAFISGYRDNPRDPENLMLASWKETKRSVTTNDNYPVNIDDVMVYSPIVSGNGSALNGMYRHVWDWNNVTIWIPNTSGSVIDYTVTWMYWKNGSLEYSYNASDGRGTDDAQITNFHLSGTDELGYWKNSENWDTLRLDANVADPSETMLGIKQLASTLIEKGESVPAINASTNNPDNLADNTFGNSDFLTLSYAAIAATEEVGTTTKTTSYYQTKNRINLSASNVPVKDIAKYKNNAIVFTQSYTEHLSEAEDALKDWTVLELEYDTSYNTWVLTRLFEEGVDKTKFNIHADNNTIVIALNYTYSADDNTAVYGESHEAVLFGYANREVLRMLVPDIRYSQSGDKVIEARPAADEEVTQFITSNVFIRENYNVALGKQYSLRNYPTYWDSTYMYTENWFRENNTEDALAAFLAVYSETPLYYVNEKGEIKDKANTDGDYREAFKYYYSSKKTLVFDTNQYSNVLYVPAGVGQLTDGKKMSVYSNTYLVEALEDYAIGYFVIDGMGTPDADVIEDIDPNDTVYSYITDIDTKHDRYEVLEDMHVREENVIVDLGSVEYGLSAFKLRFLGGGEDGVVFPTSVEFAISSDGLSYSYIGSVALDDTAFDTNVFTDEYAHASIIYSGTTDTVYGNTVADYTFDLQSVGVTARYVKATIMNHSALNAKTFMTEFQVIQNAIIPDNLPKTNGTTWVDVSEDAILMYQETLESWDRVLDKEYSFALSPTQAGYLFAEDEGYPDDGRANYAPNKFLTGQLTDGKGGVDFYHLNYANAVDYVNGTEFELDVVMEPNTIKSIKFAKGQKSDLIADGTQATLIIDGDSENGTTVTFQSGVVTFDTPIKANRIDLEFASDVNVSEFYVYGENGTNYAAGRDFYINGASENRLGDGSEWSHFNGSQFAVNLNGFSSFEIVGATTESASFYASTDNGASYTAIAENVSGVNGVYSLSGNGYYANGINKIKVVLNNAVNVKEIVATDLYGVNAVTENDNIVSDRITYGLNTIYGLKDQSVGWMKAYAPEVSLVFDMGNKDDVGYVSVYAIESKDSVDKINQPYNVTAYVSENKADWRKVATVNANDNDNSEVALKGIDVVYETDEYVLYRYNLTFARDGELGLQLDDYQYVKVVAETDGGEDGWICLTEVEVYKGHECYPVIDLTDDKFEKNAIGLTAEELDAQKSEVRPTFFRGFYDSDKYKEETATESYTLNIVYNNVPAEAYTTEYVFGNVEQRALDGRGTPYFYGGDQMLFRVTTNYLSAADYDYQGDWVSTYKLLADSRIYYTDCTSEGDITTRLFTTTSVPTPMTICNVLARDEYTGELPDGYNGDAAYYYLPIYLKNSLDYLKAVGYGVDTEGHSAAQYLNMPTNKVEISGTIKWDTNYEYESEDGMYSKDQDGVSLNIAPLGAKTNLGEVTYNNKDYDAESSLRFGSVWYIDDAAYYNTHTHMQQYGTLIMTMNNLNRYMTDTYPSSAPYTSVYEDFGLQLTKLETVEEVTGVVEIKDITEVIKLSAVTEVIRLSGITEVADEASSKFSLVVDGETKYYTCNEDIVVDAADKIGSVWASGDYIYYCSRYNVRTYKYTTTDENGVVKYWYCAENVNRVNFIDDEGHWYCADDTVQTKYSVKLANGTMAYYYKADGEQTDPVIQMISRDSNGVAHYWNSVWTFTTVGEETDEITGETVSVTKYWYSPDFNGIAGGVVEKDGVYYATSHNMVYKDLLITVDGNGTTRYWSASTEAAFDMLADLQSIITGYRDESGNITTFDKDQVMAGVDRLLEYVNNYGKGKYGQNPEYLNFGGIVKHVRANKYYYYSNVSTYLVPKEYEDGNIFEGVDSDKKDGQNMTQLLGVYNYDQRYLEFDAILAGIPAGQKDAQVVAIPYVIYANNYEFLEFGEHLGEKDEYVMDTWHSIFTQFYGGENSGNNVRYYVYGGAVARSINEILGAQKTTTEEE